jgi:hypothetical protein
MNSLISDFILWASEGLIGLLVVAVIRLWLAFLNYKNEVSNKYATQDELRMLFAEQKTDLHTVKETVERILGMVHEIKGSLHGITRE